MSAVWATTTFAVSVTATGADQSLQLGDQRDSADAVVVQCPQFFSAVPPTATTVTGVQLGYLAVNPGGPDDPSGV